MTDMTRNEAGNTLFLRYIYLVLAIMIIAAFFLLFGQTSVWYDEANYLVIAGAIQETGYPIWFGDPDKPKIFIDSPPGLLYLISIFSTYVTNDLFVIRLSNSLISLVIALFALFIYIRRKGLDVILLSVTALFCAVTYFFIVELVQVRMDLPLAALTFLVLILAALAEEGFKEHSERNLKALANRSLFLTLALLICASALLFLTKFQAVCVTACLFLNVLLCQDFRRLASWVPFIAHITGGVIGILLLVILMMSNPFVPGAEVFDRVAYDFYRVIPLSSSFSARRILNVFQEVMPKVIVPAILLWLVKDRLSIYGKDPLVRLSVLMIVTVVAFNIAVYRMPTAGHYYMIQAALPLGYITAQSFNSFLQEAHRWWHVLILPCVLTFHALLNVQFGGGGPERSTNFLKDLMGPTGRLDASKVVAANVAPALGPEELLLLGWWNQSLCGSLLAQPASPLRLLVRYGSNKSREPSEPEGSSESWSVGFPW